MSHRFVAVGLMLVSLLLIYLGYLLYERPDLLGLCPPGRNCLDPHLFYGLANPLWLHLRPLPVLFLLLTFVRRDAFIAWCRFALVAFPLAFVIVIESAPISHDFLPIIPPRPQMTELVVRLLCLGSLAALAPAYLREWWKRGR